ncbi:MAG: hypothetical protein JXJ30_06050 [Halothiobacillaceae bacterium]|nr:hypothetical protein [Halothiobacillaceae bacterium]
MDESWGAGFPSEPMIAAEKLHGAPLLSPVATSIEAMLWPRRRVAGGRKAL